MQLAPSLHQIGSNVVNCYLVEQGGQLTLIDAGLPGQWRELQHELRRIGRSLEDIRALLLTHGDTDHIGFAARLHREHGTPVYVHELDVPRAHGEIKKSQQRLGSGEALAAAWLHGVFRSERRPECPTDAGGPGAPNSWSATG